WLSAIFRHAPTHFKRAEVTTGQVNAAGGAQSATTQQANRVAGQSGYGQTTQQVGTNQQPNMTGNMLGQNAVKPPLAVRPPPISLLRLLRFALRHHAASHHASREPLLLQVDPLLLEIL